MNKKFFLLQCETKKKTPSNYNNILKWIERHGEAKKWDKIFTNITITLKRCVEAICTAQHGTHPGLLVAAITNQSLTCCLLPFQIVFASTLLRLCLPAKLFFLRKEESNSSLYLLRYSECSAGPALTLCQSYGRLSCLSLIVALLCCGCSSPCRVVLADRRKTEMHPGLHSWPR